MRAYGCFCHHHLRLELSSFFKCCIVFVLLAPINPFSVPSAAAISVVCYGGWWLSLSLYSLLQAHVVVDVLNITDWVGCVFKTNYKLWVGFHFPSVVFDLVLWSRNDNSFNFDISFCLYFLLQPPSIPFNLFFYFL